MRIALHKAQLRREVAERVRAMDPEDRKVQEAALADRLTMLPGFAAASTVLLFASAFADEVDTKPMLRRALATGKRLACPRVVAGTKRLELLEVTDPSRDLVAGRWSIPEPNLTCRIIHPVEVDWALIPGVAFDRLGFRLGRGGGFYDRLLPQLRPEASRWSVILTPQWVKEVPRELHDCPVDGVADHLQCWAKTRPAIRAGM